MSRIVLAVLLAPMLALTLYGCSASRYSDTFFPYELDQAALKEKPIETVVIASANISGEPTRYHLQQPAGRIDKMVASYLDEHGYEVAPGYLFDNAWNQAIRTHGEMYDPTTGRVDPQTWQAVMVQTMAALAEDGKVDAVVFTDVVEHDVVHNVGMEHLAQWWGVSRRPDTLSNAQGVPADFNWNRPLKGASLVITVYRADSKGLFTSRGGLDTLQVVNNKRNDGTYVRRKKLLDNERNLWEGIRLAFHPFIPMADYPATTP